MSRYARDIGLLGDDAALLVMLVSALDDEYLQWLSEQMKKGGKT
jgi:hypothetical protein